MTRKPPTQWWTWHPARLSDDQVTYLYRRAQRAAPHPADFPPDSLGRLLVAAQFLRRAQAKRKTPRPSAPGG